MKLHDMFFDTLADAKKMLSKEFIIMSISLYVLNKIAEMPVLRTVNIHFSKTV